MQPAPVILAVVAAFQTLGVPYCIGGSIASATYGEPRATRDVDILAALQRPHVAPFVAQLRPDFYVVRDDVQTAVATAAAGAGDPAYRPTFNLIHTASLFKVAVFVATRRAFDQQQLQRAHPQPITDDPTQTVQIISPEDTILVKLEWYRLGGEVSDRQWQDVRSVLRTQGNRLDTAYLTMWAVQLHVSDLLAAVQRDERPPPNHTGTP